MRHFFSFLIVVFLVTAALPAAAEQDSPYFNTSGLPIPRFISLNSDKVFMRTGPGLRYPIRWVYTKRNMPIEVIQEFDTWRKIRDYDGETGWVHQSLLSGRRTAIVNNGKGVVLLKKPQAAAQPVAILEPEVLLSLEECNAQWCEVEVAGFSGWVEKNSLWGVYAEEELD
jgi:SH3-like domain-containing protein